MSHLTLRLLKPECALDKSWCQEELSVAVKRAVTLLHSHTITSRAGKGEPGKGQDGQRARGGMNRAGIARATASRPLGLPEAVASSESLPSLTLISSSEKGGMDDF